MVGITMFLSVAGVYIGRFLRFNSWDIIEHPRQLMTELITLTASNGGNWNISDVTRLQVSKLYEAGAMPFLEFSLLYTIFFLILYIFVYEARKVQ